MHERKAGTLKSGSTGKKVTSKKQAIAIGMEIGLHNGTLAIYIALNVMQNSSMALPAGMYGLLMFFTAALFGFLVNVKRAR